MDMNTYHDDYTLTGDDGDMSDAIYSFSALGCIGIGLLMLTQYLAILVSSY